jgi:hypothetical protein
VTKGPPAYAWDWFARQRLLWREVRSRIAASSTPAASRYAAAETRSEVVPMLRAEYQRNDTVRAAVDAVVTELTFLGRTDRPFTALGVRNAPRGMRWWWTALTGEELDTPRRPGDGVAAGVPPEADQLTLDEILRGYGG